MQSTTDVFITLLYYPSYFQIPGSDPGLRMIKGDVFMKHWLRKQTGAPVRDFLTIWSCTNLYLLLLTSGKT
jgi:hypothetical protein